ncbi:MULTISPECIES: hypothetical protein [unclassified Devosia]|uniref:spike base protein, RCAP_Rcc01079 family n=1 Tax=unclassified Devosia TaxID=196773 RepID=UPI00155208B5|nr:MULTISPECIES: hypothetical protein [unclassified Devosia]
MTDRFEHHAKGLDSPASHAFTITPNDSEPLIEATRAIYIGAGGALSVTLLSGAQVVFVNLSGGSVLPVRVVQVKASGTTASQILGLV